MKSPITDKEMTLQKENRTLIFRKEAIDVLYHYYLCDESGEQFTSTELDEINIIQLYNQYRDKYNIPFPDEIKAIREMYGLSAAKMSEALGFGANVYRNYEKGEVPNESNGKLIRLAQDSNSFQQIINYSGTLGPKAKENIQEKIDEIRRLEKSNDSLIDLYKYFLGSNIPDEFSGYRKPNLDKFTEMIVFFTERLQPWKTKLNKLLFYSDFSYFREKCFSISGVRYRAIDMGPVPNNFNAIYDYVADKDDINIYRTEFSNGSLGEQFKPHPKRFFKSELFAEDELKILERIATSFAEVSTQDIIIFSHKEKAWKDNYERGKQLISYKYGFELQTV